VCVWLAGWLGLCDLVGVCYACLGCDVVLTVCRCTLRVVGFAVVVSVIGLVSDGLLRVLFGGGGLGVIGGFRGFGRCMWVWT